MLHKLHLVKLLAGSHQSETKQTSFTDTHKAYVLEPAGLFESQSVDSANEDPMFLVSNGPEEASGSLAPTVTVRSLSFLVSSTLGCSLFSVHSGHLLLNSLQIKPATSDCTTTQSLIVVNPTSLANGSATLSDVAAAAITAYLGDGQSLTLNGTVEEGEAAATPSSFISCTSRTFKAGAVYVKMISDSAELVVTSTHFEDCHSSNLAAKGSWLYLECIDATKTITESRWTGMFTTYADSDHFWVSESTTVCTCFDTRISHFILPPSHGVSVDPSGYVAFIDSPEESTPPFPHGVETTTPPFPHGVETTTCGWAAVPCLRHRSLARRQHPYSETLDWFPSCRRV